MSIAGDQGSNPSPSDCPCTSTKESDDPWFDFKASHYVTAFLTLGLLVVAAFQLCTYRQQAGIAETQNKIIQAQQRPWLSFTNETSLATDLKFEPASTAIKVRYFVQNTGHLPAKFVVKTHPYFIGYGGLNPNEERQTFIDQIRSGEGPLNARWGDVSFPGDTSPDEETASFEEPMVQEMINNKKSSDAIIIACIDYQFIASEERHQTCTVYLLDKIAPSIPLAQISPAEGNVRATDLSLTRHSMGTTAD